MKKVTQKDVISKLALGYSYDEICTEYKIKKDALYTHLKRIRRSGVEPSDINACRQAFLPGSPPFPIKQITTQNITPLQDKILRLLDKGFQVREASIEAKIGFQTAQNAACEGLKRIGIERLRKPAHVWRAQLREYFKSIDTKKPVDPMDDPAFN